MTKYLYLFLIASFFSCQQRTKFVKNTPLLPKKEIIVLQKDSLPTIDSLAKYYSYSSGKINQKKFWSGYLWDYSMLQQKGYYCAKQTHTPRYWFVFLVQTWGWCLLGKPKTDIPRYALPREGKNFYWWIQPKSIGYRKNRRRKSTYWKITENIAPDEYSSLTGIFFVAHPEAQKKLSYYITSSLSTFPFSPKEKQEAQKKT